MPVVGWEAVISSFADILFQSANVTMNSWFYIFCFKERWFLSVIVFLYHFQWLFQLLTLIVLGDIILCPLCYIWQQFVLMIPFVIYFLYTGEKIVFIAHRFSKYISLVSITRVKTLLHDSSWWCKQMTVKLPEINDFSCSQSRGTDWKFFLKKKRVFIIFSAPCKVTFCLLTIIFSYLHYSDYMFIRGGSDSQCYTNRTHSKDGMAASATRAATATNAVTELQQLNLPWGL